MCERDLFRVQKTIVLGGELGRAQIAVVVHAEGKGLVAEGVLEVVRLDVGHIGQPLLHAGDLLLECLVDFAELRLPHVPLAHKALLIFITKNL